MSPLLVLGARLGRGNLPSTAQIFLYCAGAPGLWLPHGPVGPRYPWILPWKSGPGPWRGGILSVSHVIERFLGRLMITSAQMGPQSKQWGHGLAIFIASSGNMIRLLRGTASLRPKLWIGSTRGCRCSCRVAT